MDFTILSRSQTEEHLKTSLENGLKEKDAYKRIKKYGKNISENKERFVILNRLFSQVKSPIIYILIIGAIITLLLQSYTDTLIIAFTLLINVLIGMIQEGKASKVFQELQKLDVQTAIVRRDKKFFKINAADLVPGDVVILEAGNSVPADIRIYKQNTLKVSESKLTGEWESVEKSAANLMAPKPFNEQTNMLWKGTLLTSGNAEGIVLATGKNTRVGLISSLIQAKKDETPLQHKIRELTHLITFAIVVIILVILLIGLIRGIPLSEIIFISVAVAVAAMPEGLPAAVTVVLAIGMHSMTKKKGLVKRLNAAETLGSTSWIIVDKTGTLTKGETSLTSLILPNGEEFVFSDKQSLNAESIKLLTGAIHTSNAKDVGKYGETSGDSIEKAVLERLNKLNMKVKKVLKDYLPFDSALSFAAALKDSVSPTKPNTLFLSGKPEIIFEVINQENYKWENIKKLFNEKLNEGKRIIAVGSKHTSLEKIDINNKDELFDGLEFLGLLVFEDEVRDDVASSIQFIKDSNINITIATGDNPKTALYVASRSGIASINSNYLLGSDLEKFNDNELYKRMKTTNIFARMLPEHKLRLANVLSENDEYVAMTGDGVNDAPTLKAASIGISLAGGTSVAKEAADLILVDDSFTTITESIKEGRRIIDNLRKIVGYLLSTSFSEVFLITGALILGTALPLTPAQILWANIVGESFIVFALAFEKLNPSSLKLNPKDRENKKIITKKLRSLIINISIRASLLLISLFLILHYFTSLTTEEIRTVMFIGISIGSIFFAASFKDITKPIWKINLSSNLKLIFAMFISIFFVFVAFVVEPIRAVLQLQDIGIYFIPTLMLFAIINLLIIENVKIKIQRKYDNS